MSQIKTGIFLNYVIIGLNVLLGLLYTPYMLRMLGQNEYGLYSLVASIIAYLTLLDFGFGSAIIRYTAKLIADHKYKEQWEMNGMFFIVYSIIGFLAFCIGLFLYYNIEVLFEKKMTLDEIEQARIMILLLVFNLAVTFPLSVFGALITAYQDFIFQRVLTIMRLVLSSAIIVLLLYWGYKAVAMVVVQTVFNISILVINCLYCFKKLHIRVVFAKFNWNLLKEICIYSFWIFLSAIIDRIYWGTGQFVLGATMGTAAVAVFSVAILLQQMYMTFSSSISNVLLPRITILINQEGTEKLISGLFIKIGRLQSVIMSFILSGFVIFGLAFVEIWAGKDYAQSYIVALIFFVALFVPTIQTTGYVILQAKNQMKFRSLLYLVISITSLFFQIIWSRTYGVIGCAVAIGGALMIGQGVIMNIYYGKVQKIEISQFWIEIGKTLILPICVTLFFMLIRPLLILTTIMDLLISIIIYAILYLPLCYKFSLNSYEKNLITAPVKKILSRIIS